MAERNRQTSGGSSGSGGVSAEVLEILAWVLIIGAAVIAVYLAAANTPGCWIFVALIIAGVVWLRQTRSARAKARAYQIWVNEQHRLAWEAHQRQQAWLVELAYNRALGNLLVLEPVAFEQFLARLLEASGYTQVAHSGQSGDKGVDIHAVGPQGEYVIVQCKLYTPGRKVGAPEVQRFLGAIHQHRAARGIFVTTSDYTTAAYEIASQNPILLTNGDRLVQWIQMVQNTVETGPGA